MKQVLVKLIEGLEVYDIHSMVSDYITISSLVKS